MNPTTETFMQLGIAALLGLLVGLERQRTSTLGAGLRTFSIITVSGAVFALLERQTGSGGILLASGLVAMVSVVALARFYRMKREPLDQGFTTEVTVVLMYGVGAYVVLGNLVVAVAVGTGAAVLLQFKPELHGIAERLGDEDLRAIMRFALISGIILPVLPNRTYGPLDVLNPFEIWLMVVLIVGISLGGYIIYKFFGERAGVWLGGILGGAISSTATTVSYARRGAREPDRAQLDALVIVIASSVVYVRVLFEISVVAPTFLAVAALPIGCMLVASVGSIALAALRRKSETGEMLKQVNPTELRSALMFAVLYSIVLLALAVAKRHFRGEALYLVAALSGLTDLDAITLSTARMVQPTGAPPVIDASTGWRLIVTAVMSNLVFKAFLVSVLGNRGLFGRVSLFFAIPIVAGALLLALGMPL